MTLEILQAGPFTTVQDLGRPGWGSIGVPTGGAADAPSLRIANRLVGNPDAAAGLELTLAGPQISFAADAWVALTGSRFVAAVGDDPVPHATAFLVRTGQTLSIGRTLEGARAVLAVRGGLDVPLVLGSRSTFVAGGLGGIDGRPLRRGDRLSTGAIDAGEARLGWRSRARAVRERLLPFHAAEAVLRVIVGPQIDAFNEEARETLLTGTYRVSTLADRTGLRLEGPRIAHRGAADLLPEGIAPGGIQVPASGQPIVLGCDHPTTGGYAKIATVIAADLWRIGQAKPGDRLRFVAVEVSEAQALYRRQEELLRSVLEGSGA
jgi:antagonist of KipI